MSGCKADPSIERQEIGGFKFPLGVYPIEAMTPKAGYLMHFEPADGDESEGEWEEWPDRYLFDAVLSASRVETFVTHLLGMLPSRIYPILDVLGRDAHREIDPYISYELIGLDRVMDALRKYRDFFFEDGLVGFGVMSEEPFFYMFVDEHKIVTIRAEPSLKDRIERLLLAFDLESCEDAAGADAAAHEHRGVLLTPDDEPLLLSGDEIVEELKDEWKLLLNIDPDTNVDAEGNDLGVTPWRCVVRCEWPEKEPKYAEVLLHAACLREAEELSFDAAESLQDPRSEHWQDAVIVAADRVLPEEFAKLATKSSSAKRSKSKSKTPDGIDSIRWM